MTKFRNEMLCIFTAAAMIMSGTAIVPAETDMIYETDAVYDDGYYETEDVYELEEPAAPVVPEEPTGPFRTYENDGLTLSIPEEYDGRLTVTVPEDTTEGMLFSVSENASIEAGKSNGYDEDDGMGYLFSICKTDEDTLHEMLCGDMSGAEVFAVNDKGEYLLFLHPTDVRVPIMEYEEQQAAVNAWTTLELWATTYVKDKFLADNQGLTAKEYGNTGLDITLAQIAYQDMKDYMISTLEFGQINPGSLDPTPYLEKLEGMKLEEVDTEFPDGEYVVLTLPKEGRRFDFSYNEEYGSFIRETYTVEEGVEHEIVYIAHFPDPTTKASAVMNEWYHALAESQNITERTE